MRTFNLESFKLSRKESIGNKHCRLRKRAKNAGNIFNGVVTHDRYDQKPLQATRIMGPTNTSQHCDCVASAAADPSLNGMARVLTVASKP